MTAAVTGEKGDLAIRERAYDVGVRRRAEWGIDHDLMHSLQPGHRVQSATADDSDLCLLQDLSWYVKLTAKRDYTGEKSSHR